MRLCKGCGVQVGPKFHYCDSCRQERQRQATKTYMARARKEQPERIAKAKARAQYKISGDELDALYAEAGDTCPLCQRPFTEEQDSKRAIDHHHVSGKVRGIICTRCNSGIGLAHEDAERMARMADYLRGARQG